MDPLNFLNVGFAVVAIGFALLRINKTTPPYRWMKYTLAVDAGLIALAYTMHILFGDELSWAIDVANTWVLATLIGSLIVGIGRGYD